MPINEVTGFDLETFLAESNISSDYFRESEMPVEDLLKVLSDFDRRKDALEGLTQNLLDECRKITNVHSYKGRVKDREHLLEKIVRKQKKYRLSINVDTYGDVITDLVGVRLLHLFKDDWLEIHKFITKTFDILLPKNRDDSEDPGYHNPKAYIREGDPKELRDEFKNWGLTVENHEFGYRSLHYLIKREFSGVKAIVEIQVRTVFEEAWSEIDHLIRYPTGVKALSTESALVLLNRIAGSADETALFIRNNYRQWERLALEHEGGAFASFSKADAEAFARITGLPQKTIEREVWRPNQTGEKEARQKREQQSELVGLRKGLSEQIRSTYYGSKDSGLSQYYVLIDGQRIETPIFTTNERIGITASMRDVDAVLLKTESPQNTNAKELAVKNPDHPNSTYALDMLRYFREQGVRLWNDPMYCLRKATFDGPLKLIFSMSDFFSSRFGPGLLEDEIVDASLSTDDPAIIAKRLPIRDKYLARDHLCDFDGRMCAGGIAAACAFRRQEQNQDDFVILLERRSESVADERGQLSVVPLGYHQPQVGQWEEEVKLHWTTLREIYEEVFGGQSAERGRNEINLDWYCMKEGKKSEAVRDLRDGNYKAEILVTGFGIDTKQGNYLVSGLVCVPDAKYWAQFHDKMKPMWEHKTKRFLEVSSRDSEGLKKLIGEEAWCSEGLFAFMEALLLLKKRYPKLVDLPELERGRL